MKRILCIIVVVDICILTLVAAGCSGLSQMDIRQYTEDRLNLMLPEDCEITFTDTHGGFLGDGDLVATVTFADSDSAAECLNAIKDEWLPLPMQDEQMLVAFYGGEPCAWSEDEEGNKVDVSFSEGALSENGLPKVQNGYYCYRDRYYEQYGEKCEFNPVIQNCTLAIFDIDRLKLYFLELDF